MIHDFWNLNIYSFKKTKLFVFITIRECISIFIFKNDFFSIFFFNNQIEFFIENMFQENNWRKVEKQTKRMKLRFRYNYTKFIKPIFLKTITNLGFVVFYIFPFVIYFLLFFINILLKVSTYVECWRDSNKDRQYHRDCELPLLPFPFFAAIF